MATSQTVSGEEPRWKSRDEALEEAFAYLDRDGSGFIDLKELTSLASKVSPAENLETAKRALDWLDYDGDHKVTKEEFFSAFQALDVAMDDEMFYGQIDAIMGDKELYQPSVQSDYKHPAQNREYLSSTVLPYLEPGLEKLLYAMQEHRVMAASGQEWEDGLWRPDDWKPMQALRWLGEWMLAEKARDDEANAPVVIQGPITFAELPRETKMEMAFRHLDRDGSGFLDVNELLALVESLKIDSALEDAQKQLEWLDTDGDNIVTMDEYKSALHFLTDELDDTLFDASIKAVLGASHLSFFSREEKLTMCFRKLDSDGSGEVGYGELVILGRALDPDKGEDKVLSAIEFMDKDGDQAIDEHEFLEALLMATQKLPDDQFDVGIKTILDSVDADRSRVEDGAQDFLSKFAEFVRGIPLHTAVDQMSPLDLQQRLRAATSRSSRRASKTGLETPGAGSGVVIIDCRGEEEQAVSAIADARMVPLPDLTEDGEVPGLEEALSAALNLEELGGAGAVVVYSGVGHKSGVVVQMLQELIPAPAPVEQPPPPEGAEPLAPVQPPKVKVFNLCGGMMGWWNTGGDVVRAGEGGPEKVEEFHPHMHKYMGYVATKTRPNGFRLARKTKSP